MNEGLLFNVNANDQLRDASEYAKARASAEEERPMLMIGAATNDANRFGRTAELYDDQLKRGDAILHCAPWSHRSWLDPKIKQYRQTPEMHVVKNGTKGYMTNSTRLAQQLKTWTSEQTPAQVVMNALTDSMRHSGETTDFELAGGGGPSPHEPLVSIGSQDAAEELVGYWDDVRGGWLPPELVKKARAEEVAEVQKYKVIEIVPRRKMYDAGKTNALDTVVRYQ